MLRGDWELVQNSVSNEKFYKARPQIFRRWRDDLFNSDKVEWLFA